MSLDKTQWIDAAWGVLRSIPTGGAGEALEEAWRQHQARAKPVALLFGAYDAGKSSLLKRLLFEDGVSVPSEITVSGRRETFSVDEVEGTLWAFRDSPGLAGGNDEHDEKALESLDLADLFLWVLPPQLVTSNKETFDDIVTGRRFGVDSTFVTGGLLAVISRIDEAGIDPAENPDGFADLCHRKQTEFGDLLAAVGAASPTWGVHAVSADPYQGVGNETPDASIYAMGAGWDGVPEIRASLAAAHDAASELRTLAGFRFASRAIVALSEMVVNERGAREEARTTCENDLERAQLWRTSLDVLRRKCSADLHRVVEDELLSFTRVGTVAAADALQNRLAETVDRWSDQAYAEFARLTAAADQETAERGRSPSMEQLKRISVEMAQTETEDKPLPGSSNGKFKKHASGLGRAFRDGFKAYARLALGMSPEEAAKLVREFKQSGESWAAFSKARKGKTFASETVAKKASGYVKWADALDALGPLVEQLGPLLFEIGGDVLSAIEADKKAEQRRALRESLRGAALEVEAEAMTGFDEMVAAFGEWLDQLEGAHEPAKRMLDEQILALMHYEKQLAELLKKRPD